MHASLARIGRACTVDDEEPPAAPHNGSTDTQSDTGSEAVHEVRPIRELIHDFRKVAAPVYFIPFIDAAIHASNKLSRKPHTQTSTSHLRSENHVQCATSEKLAQICHLRTLLLNAAKLDGLAVSIGELFTNVLPVCFQSGRMASREMDGLQRYFLSIHSYTSPFQFMKSSRCKTYASLQNHPTRTECPSSSDLSELRVICEHLRQLLTQTTLCAHETNAMMTKLGCVSTSQDSPSSTLVYLSDRLTSVSLLNSHNLVYSGLCNLAHIDLTRYSHGELWEMMRGTEELDILSKQIRSSKQSRRFASLHKFLSQELLAEDTSRCLTRLLHAGLIASPLFNVSSLSVAYLFVLFALQRSRDMAKSVYFQITAALTEKNHRLNKTLENNPESSKSELTLVDAFREYLNKNYERTASEYLRGEYEFITTFLDVLSQSTNLLYQVQKLKLVCTAAAAIQSKKAEALFMNKPVLSGSVFSHKESDSHALSVEGKHGILVRRAPTVVNKPTTSREIPKTHPPQNGKFLTTRYQDTLQRACTIDRYVATGSSLFPVHVTDSDQPTSSAIKPNTADCLDTKNSPVRKGVQWSDHREISTRHQVIGRFLEMVWEYTETHINTLFLCPPVSVVASAQAESLNIHERANIDRESAITNPIRCLCMPTKQLKLMANAIRSSAKPDLFPNGLLPAIRRQALYFDELSQKQACYTELFTNLLDVHRISSRTPEPPTYESHRLNCRPCMAVSESFHNPSPTPINCASLKTTLECVRRTCDGLLPKLTVITISPIHEPCLMQDFNSLLRLLVRCVRSFTGADSSKTNALIQWLNDSTNSLGSSFSFDVNTPFAGQQQPVALINMLYEYARRMDHISSRFFLTLNSHQRSLTTICVRAIQSEQSKFVRERFASLIRYAFYHSAALFQLGCILTVLRTTEEHFSIALKQTFPEVCSTLQSDDSRNVTPGRFCLVASIRLNKTVSCLQNLKRSVERALSEIELSRLNCRDSFLFTSCQLIRKWRFGSFEAVNAGLVTSFLSDLTHADFHQNCSGCAFHSTNYNSLIGAVFELFCQQCLGQINRIQDTHSSANVSKITALPEHIFHVKVLAELLEKSACTVPEELFSCLYDCPGFRTLRALGAHDLPATDQESIQPHRSVEPIHQSALTTNTPTAVAFDFPRRSSNRLSLSCNTLFNLAAGVRNTIASPLKQFIQNPDKSHPKRDASTQ